MAVFLAVTNTQPPDEKPIVATAERVLAARLRDASFFWEADRRSVLEARLDRLDTLLFHKALGSYRRKAERVAALAEWIAREAFDRPDQAEFARRAALIAKADLTTDMVGEFPELQGVMGGIYAREEGQPEIWGDLSPLSAGGHRGRRAPPSADLGAACQWAAVSHRQLDTVVGLFGAGRAAHRIARPIQAAGDQGAVRILTDLPELTGLDRGRALAARRARRGLFASAAERPAFIRERFTYALSQRGMPVRPCARWWRDRSQRSGDATRHRPLRAAGCRGAAGEPRVGRLRGARDSVQAREEHRAGNRGLRTRPTAPNGWPGSDRAQRARRAGARRRDGQTASGHRACRRGLRVRARVRRGGGAAARRGSVLL
jgi:glycyl-tRNA synthetase beta chain